MDPRTLLELVERIARSLDPLPWDRLAQLGIGFLTRKDVAVLELPPSADLQALARAVRDLGPPVDVDIVSPPIRDPDRPASRPAWDVKQSVCQEMGGKRVWFGLETAGGTERLVSVSIPRDPEARDRLPPEGRDGPFAVTVSLGWSGGHGEAVLDERGAIRFHDGLPLFFDADRWEGVLQGLDLGGSFEGCPVVCVTGTGRLERRRKRNPSIPGAPRERYVALVPATVLDARVVGERAG